MEKILDMDGWPIHEGARVHVPRRDSSLLSAGWRDSQGRRALPSFGGEVKKFLDHPSGPVVEIVDFETRGRRTVRADQCRVQRGDSKASRIYRIDEAAAAAAPKPRRRRRR